MQPAYIGVHLAVDDGQPLARAAADDGHQGFVRVEGRLFVGVQGALLQAAGLVGRVLRDHLARGGAGGIHALIVEDHLHPPTLSLGKRDIVKVEQRVRHPAERAGQPHARVDEKTVDAMLFKVGDLAADFVSVQVVIPEPEGQDGEFGRWVQEGRERRVHGCFQE